MSSSTERNAVTLWFPKNIHPVRKGVYQVADEVHELDGRWHAYWNGERFGFRTCMGAEHAFRQKDSVTQCGPFAMWRGLSKEPK